MPSFSKLSYLTPFKNFIILKEKVKLSDKNLNFVCLFCLSYFETTVTHETDILVKSPIVYVFKMHRFLSFILIQLWLLLEICGWIFSHVERRLDGGEGEHEVDKLIT